MDTQKLHDLIDKVIGKDGPLRTPAYWMRRVLNGIAVALEDSISRITISLGNQQKQLDSIQKSIADTNLATQEQLVSIQKSIVDTNLATQEQLASIQKSIVDINVRISRIAEETSSGQYFTVVALEDGVRVGMNYREDVLEYRIDGGEWTTLPRYTATPNMTKGQRMEIKASLVPSPKSYDNGIGTFYFLGNVRIEGSVMSLIHKDNFYDLSVQVNAFSRLFKGCEQLVEVAHNLLPATTLTKQCYYEMFKGCKSLVNAPELPATTLAEECYYHMFEECTSLVDAPELPATTLAENCYYGMFSNCTSLVNAPELPATTLAHSCYFGMFFGCTSLVNAPELPATTLAEACYREMFEGCKSLVNAPELPATTLARSCYSGMFLNCKSLVNAPELPATALAVYCYWEMFKWCTSLVNAPELPATALAENCYREMFSDCINLSYIKAMALNIGAGYSYNWVYNVAPEGTFVKNENATWDVTGSYGVPEGWTIETAAV